MKELTQEHFDLAYEQARRFSHLFPAYHLEYEDLLSAALSGLTKAARQYNPERHDNFAGLAKSMIRNEINQWIRQTRAVMESPTKLNSAEAPGT